MEISKRDGRELHPDRLQQPKSNLDTTVGLMSLLIGEPHCSKGTTSLCGRVKCSSRVPSIQLKANPQTQHDVIYKKLQKPRARTMIYMVKFYLREADHDRCTMLLSDQASELPPALLNSLLVVLAHIWVVLRHLC